MDRQLKICLLTFLTGVSCLAITPYLPFFGPGSVASGHALPTAGLLFWFKADSLTGYTNGQSVLSWTDSSGKGHTATETSGCTNCPYFTNTVDGYPAIYFGQTNGQFLAITTNTDWFSANPTGAEYYIVVRVKNDPAVGSLANGAWYIVGSDTANFPQGGSTVIDGSFKNASGTTVDPVPSLTTNFHLYAVQATKSGSTVNWTNFLDGTKLISDNARNWSTNMNGVQPGKIGHTGSGPGSYFNGWIAEFFCYTNNLSGANVTLVKQYITNKYGITLTFP